MSCRSILTGAVGPPPRPRLWVPAFAGTTVWCCVAVATEGASKTSRPDSQSSQLPVVQPPQSSQPPPSRPASPQSSQAAPQSSQLPQSFPHPQSSSPPNHPSLPPVVRPPPSHPRLLPSRPNSPSHSRTPSRPAPPIIPASPQSSQLPQSSQRTLGSRGVGRGKRRGPPVVQPSQSSSLPPVISTPPVIPASPQSSQLPQSSSHPQSSQRTLGSRGVGRGDPNPPPNDYVHILTGVSSTEPRSPGPSCILNTRV